MQETSLYGQVWLAERMKSSSQNMILIWLQLLKIQEGRDRGKKHCLIILAEGVMGGNEFAEKLSEFGDYHTRVSILGHVVRGGAPSARDRVLASKFGAYAVELLQEGKVDYVSVSMTTKSLRLTSLIHLKTTNINQTYHYMI